ncbi:MAG: hypothetical protein H0T89_05360 [Deltaproteobacteria bacterium]|nr:hypothetical protein [Deltaproteobacteria bacterium]MDQ3299980.1 hypothetical protein [Myxococcota bacterium]
MRSLSKIFAVAVMVAVSACGGSSDSGPTPLSKRYDDMYIAQIPLDQKQSVVTTQNDWSVAKMENAKADADFNEVTQQLTVVKNDQKAAKLAIDSALSNKKSAEASNDMNKMNAASRDLKHAELAKKAADARLKYYEAYRNYLKKQQRYTAENMYWREAQYELAKAQLGKANNVAPKGVSYDSFPRQETERQKRANTARDKANSEKGRAASAREAWLKQQQAADQASGTRSDFPDPMGQTATAGAGS